MAQPAWAEVSDADAHHPGQSEGASDAALVLGEVWAVRRDWPAAKRQFELALAIQESLTPTDAKLLESPTMWLAGVLLELGELDAARGHYLKLLQLKQSAFGPLHYEQIGQLWALAHLSLKQGKLVDAEAHVTQELKIWATDPKFMGVPVGDASAALQNLGAIRAHQGRLAEATALHQQARDILVQPLEAAEPGEPVGAGAVARAVACEARLVALYERTGNRPQAAKHRQAGAAWAKLTDRPPLVMTDPLWHQDLLPLP
jgi:tetratricopeptide (TPR) repeat protein